MFRTHTCGELRASESSKRVTLSGWVHTRRDHGGLIFFDLRDRYGITQVTVDPKRAKDAWLTAEKVRSEYVVKVTGTVLLRPKAMVNPKLPTGDIEVQADAIDVLNAARTLPFDVSDESTQRVSNEEIRLKYRFLDLRRRRMLENLEFRAKVTQFIRTWCASRHFVEVETPLLTVSSPEGARDFLVPSRLHPGKFYALPQAPQQYKQLLMVAGLDRYFQIAPCMRDEDARADRSPGEFYQLDLETSYLTQDEFFALMEPLFIEMTETLTKKKILTKPFRRIPYRESMQKYGTDKPDLRFGLEIQDVTDSVQSSSFSVFTDAIKKKGLVRAVVASSAVFSRSKIDQLTNLVREKGAKGLAYIVVTEKGPESPILKHLGEETTKTLITAVGARPGDTIFFGAGDEKTVCESLGALRLRLGEELKLIDPNVMAFCWIVDFPMYEWNEEAKKIDFSHNPFSMPQGGMEALETRDPLSILAYQYDIVANGVELSSGAVRNNVPELMLKAFSIAGYPESAVREKFGHMLDAFSYGAPPHCGFAPGIERMIMLLRDEPNIREVTAFPKNSKAQDVMMGAPSSVDEKQLRDLHIRITKK